MKIALSGSHGFIGAALARTWSGPGVHLRRLVRDPPGATGEVCWDPYGDWDPAPLDGFDAVVHLAGENLATGRWTATKKDRLRDSRVAATANLARSIAALPRPPGVLLCASAVGYYGDRGEEELTERSDRGEGFLPALCRDWEEAAAPAAKAGVRAVHARFGVVLGRGGGSLARMLPPFRFGLGGPLGNGRQYLSWIDLDDACAAVRFLLERDDLAGPFNLCAPSPVTSAVFAGALGAALHRPARLPVPAFALRLLFGEMADAVLLCSARVRPARLEAAGFHFRFPTVEEALRHQLCNATEPGNAA